MPRPAAPVALSPGQASYVLERLRKAGSVTAAQIRGYLAEMGREIRDLEARLLHLRKAAGQPVAPQTVTRVGNGAPAASGAARRPRRASTTRRGRKAAAKPQKRKFTVTPKVLASRELQGRYLPLLNQFSGDAKARFAAIAKEKGREAAIKEMEAAQKAATGTPPAPRRRRRAARPGRAAKR